MFVAPTARHITRRRGDAEFNTGALHDSRILCELCEFCVSASLRLCVSASLRQKLFSGPEYRSHAPAFPPAGAPQHDHGKRPTNRRD